MIQFWRILHTGGRNFFRNVWLSTAATVVMTVTLTVVLITLFSSAALTATIRGVVNKIDLSIFLSDDITPTQLQQLEGRLTSHPSVKSIKYISKADALVIYRSQHQHDNLRDAISETDNPLPQSIQIKARDPNKLQPVVDLINSAEVKPLLSQSDPPTYSGDRKAVIDRIIHTSNVFKRIGLVASILFVIISTLIIFNTIRMAIFTRREEIEIMKLVGATNWFIRGPFIFEAALYGIIAAVVTLIICYSLILTGAPRLTGYIDVVSTVEFFRSHPIMIALTTFAIGIVIGAVSSLLALGRYLKL